uniref:Uncharacterized protein n=1 Tax=Plectus sambesii TaxID=2011161 RepID=A0A914UZM5_9BILA
MNDPFWRSRSSSPFYGNIMIDKRVFRGSTWAAQRLAMAKRAKDQEEAEREANRRSEVIRTQLTMTLNRRDQPSLQRRAVRQPPSWSVTRPNMPRAMNRVRFLPASPVHRSEADKALRGPYRSPRRVTLLTGDDDDYGDSVRKRRRPLRMFPGSRYPFAPPPTAKGTPILADAMVQATDDFDEATSPMVRMLVDSALANAIRSLQEEDRLAQFEAERAELVGIIGEEKALIDSLEQHIQMEYEEKMELQRIQKEMERREWARISHEAATELLLYMIPTVMDKLRERRLLIEPILYRSIAADTREMEADKAEFSDVYTTVTVDFLPWLCSRAGMEAEHAIISKHLSDAMFSHNQNTREKARRNVERRLGKIL